MRLIPDRATPRASQAEQLIFKELESVNSAGWSVGLHSLNLPEHARKRVCEIDFLLLGERGLFVLEVKGGAVDRRGGVWHTTDRRGQRHRLNESPDDQARAAMFALEKRLRLYMNDVDLVRPTVFGYATVFPDVNFDAVSVEWAPETVIDRRALENEGGLAARLDVLASFWEKKPGGQRRRLTEGEIDRCLTHLRPDFDLVPGLKQLSRTVEEELASLTERQYHFLDMYDRNPRLLLEGGAGTGKTMLAAESCRRAASSDQRVLFTCRSPVLSKFVQSQRGLEQTTVLPFHQLTRVNDNSFDVVVVDEAQDLVNTADLDALDRVLSGGLADGRWLLLLDSNNQRGLVGRYQKAAMDGLLALRPAQITLTDNCRNTIEIVTATQDRTGADLGVTSAGHGLEVVSIEGTRDVVAKGIADTLDQLEEEQISMDQIVLLAPSTFQQSVFASLPESWRRRVDVLNLMHLRRPTSGRVGFSRISDFKGLESRFVVLEPSGPADSEMNRALLYVGMTRARAALWLVNEIGSDTGI